MSEIQKCCDIDICADTYLKFKYGVTDNKIGSCIYSYL